MDASGTQRAGIAGAGGLVAAGAAFTVDSIVRSPLSAIAITLEGHAPLRKSVPAAAAAGVVGAAGAYLLASRLEERRAGRVIRDAAIGGGLGAVAGALVVAEKMIGLPKVFTSSKIFWARQTLGFVVPFAVIGATAVAIAGQVRQ